VVKSGNI